MFRRNGLSIVLAALFGLMLIGHSVAGWHFDNDERRLHGQPIASYREFLASPEFRESVSENWESEFLQMGAYVLLTVFLRQRGSAESKTLEKESVDEDPRRHRGDKSAPWPVRRGGFALAIYKNSLSLAFLGLFLISFVAHGVGGARNANQQNELHRSSARVTTAGYMTTSRFWYESLQNWQSEFLAVLALVVLSIYLRQAGSPESKPVHASHSSTGKD